MLETIGLKAEAYQAAGQRSHGEKQWLDIGMLLMQNPVCCWWTSP